MEDDDDTQYRDDVILEKLTAFGKNFRQTARLALSTSTAPMNQSPLKKNITLRRGNTNKDQVRRPSVLTKTSSEEQCSSSDYGTQATI